MNIPLRRWCCKVLLIRAFAIYSLNSQKIVEKENITPPYQAFAYYDTIQNTYLVEAGAFDVMVGNSSQNIAATTTIELTAGVIPSIKVGQKSAFYDGADINRTRKWDYLYASKSEMGSNSTTIEDSNAWVENEITFVDPGLR